MRRLAALIGMVTALCHADTDARAQPPKPAAYPPINPAAARLEQTITGLDGPGFAIAYSETREALLAACAEDTIHLWEKDALLNIRPGSGTANILRGHEGPVLALAWNDGPALVSAGLDRKLLFWQFKDGKILHTVSCPQVVRALVLSP